jgi:hypothetical protein
MLINDLVPPMVQFIVQNVSTFQHGFEHYEYCRATVENFIYACYLLFKTPIYDFKTPILIMWHTMARHSAPEP